MNYLCSSPSIFLQWHLRGGGHQLWSEVYVHKYTPFFLQVWIQSLMGPVILMSTCIEETAVFYIHSYRSTGANMYRIFDYHATSCSRYQCVTAGYRLEDSTNLGVAVTPEPYTITCQDDGTWTNTNPSRFVCARKCVWCGNVNLFRLLCILIQQCSSQFFWWQACWTLHCDMYNNPVYISRVSVHHSLSPCRSDKWSLKSSHQSSFHYRCWIFHDVWMWCWQISKWWGQKLQCSLPTKWKWLHLSVWYKQILQGSLWGWTTNSCRSWLPNQCCQRCCSKWILGKHICWVSHH